MPADFVVLIDSRTHFGDDADFFRIEAHFVGNDAHFDFDCPGVRSDQSAVLMVQSRDVNLTTNVLEINDTPVVGGLPVTTSNNAWHGSHLIVPPGTLRESGNRLHLGARDADGGTSGNTDDFLIDAVVLTYKL